MGIPGRKVICSVTPAHDPMTQITLLTAQTVTTKVSRSNVTSSGSR